ncbi:hypothetical protein GYMLUDRAFT_46060 [Collybiopsis luxurians FD-317 M1]|uniref:Uncharacterized protein n=1 Tax=Collybiopsis luxurians FD-317 M1 TaxID=944289 RepID=A0A0D0BRK3_9AGAR|nr:hypothetical protein GYMLUDRAFT_46060 [Collybiopsis luxurians FD-317 M1]
MFRARTALQLVARHPARFPSSPRLHSSRSPRPEDLPPAQTHSVQEGFAQGPVFVFNVAKRFIRYSAIGLVALGLTSAVAFEGTHFWVENVEFALPKDDAESRKWEWNLERENWSGDVESGGTDPALGFQGRHLVRAAWMAQKWGVDQSTAVLSSDAVSQSDGGLLGPRGLIIIDPRLVKAEVFLRDAIAIAEGKGIERKLRPWTMSQLLSLHASILERMGAESMKTAKAQYERAWSSQPFIGPQSARIALKIGDLNRRLGHDTEALAWWNRAVHIAQPNLEKTGVPSAMPSSPFSQRSLLFALSSLSAFYATTGDFTKAQSTAETSLDLIRSVRQPESIASISPAHALHALTLLQRSSVLAVHLAEVLYAQKKPAILSTQWLTTAAESSQRVLRGLTGLPLNNLTADQVLAPPSTTVESSFINSPTLNKPATSLYRDARRTAAEAWNLTGILLETQIKNPRAAFAAYENAVRLAGSSKEVGTPADKTLKADWEVIWGNYIRLKPKMEE